MGLAADDVCHDGPDPDEPGSELEYDRYRCVVCGHLRAAEFPGQIMCRICRAVGRARRHERRCQKCDRRFLLNGGDRITCCLECRRVGVGGGDGRQVRDPFAGRRLGYLYADGAGESWDDLVRAYEDGVV